MLLLFLFVVLAHSCNTTYIANCLIRHVDLNGDNKTDASEFDEYLYATPCGPPFLDQYNGTEIVNFFDTDGNGWIDSVDIDAENGYFIRFEQIMTAACQQCESCELYQ
jgi:hypothetical protein